MTSPDMAEAIDYADEHHDDDEVVLGLTGIVRSIRLASCRYELEEGAESGPAAGTGQLREVVSRTERLPSTEDGDRPGWVVEVEQFRVR